MIRLEEVTKIYQLGEVQVPALNGVSLNIDQGEFVAIIGPSGSGKTTLLDILGCLSKPTSGRYHLENREVSRLSDEELAGTRNKKIGFVFQSFHLLPRSTALDNVELPLLYAGIRGEARKEMALKALTAVGLSDRVHHHPNQLSGGQQQRVAIARALVNQPAILLADEPTGNLDSSSGEEILGLLKALHQQGHTIIMITHDKELAEKAQRTIQLKDGKVLNELS